MSIVVICICGQQFKADDKDAGKRTLCPHCGKVLTVPRPKTESDLRPASNPDIDIEDDRPSRPRRSRKPSSPGGAGGRASAPPKDSLAAAAGQVRAERGPTTVRSRKQSGPNFWVIFGVAAMVMIMMTVMITVLLTSGGAKLGHSVNIITGIEGSSFTLKGHKLSRAGRDLSWDPGAILIVGVERGVDLGGKRFDYGSVVIIESGNSYRLASPSDPITLPVEMKIFDKTYPEGRFDVPSGGKLKTPPPTKVAGGGTGGMQNGNGGGDGGAPPIVAVRWSQAPVAVLSFTLDDNTIVKGTPPPMPQRDYDANYKKCDEAQKQYQEDFTSSFSGQTVEIYIFKTVESSWPGDTGGFQATIWGKRMIQGRSLLFNLQIAGEANSDGSISGSLSGRIDGLGRDFAINNVKFDMVPEKASAKEKIPTTPQDRKDF